MLLGALLLALLMHWPLPLHLGSDIPRDWGDPLAQAWKVAWIGHALLHEPGHLFQANMYWPLHNTLAFTDAPLGYAPAGLIGTGAKAALIRYDLLFLFAYALAFVGAYLLARELGVGSAAAAIAGVAFAYAPWRLGQDNHLNILSSGGIPLALFLLVRGYRRGSPGLILAGWLVAAWQILLGISLGIQLAYLLLALAIVAVVYWYRRRTAVGRGVIAATAAGIAILVLTTAFVARPFIQVHDDYPESRRTLTEVEFYSPDLGDFLRVPAGNTIRGGESDYRQESVREGEHALFPGAVILLLAIGGLVAPVYTRSLRVLLVIGILGAVVFSLGYDHNRAVPIQPYKFVFEHVPGWDAIRVPSRLMTLTTLGLALLAAAGAQQLIGWAVRRGHRLRGPAVASAVAAFLMVGVLVEGAGFEWRDGGLHGPLHPSVPPAPSGQLGVPAPQLHLPFNSTRQFGASDLYVYWSTDGFPDIANGWGGFLPRSAEQFYRDAAGFPDSASVARLRARGIRTVIVHRDIAPGTPWADAARKHIDGLPLTREVRGDVVIYDLEPSRAG